MKNKVESGVDCASMFWLEMTMITRRICENIFFTFDFKRLRNYLIIASIKNKHYRLSDKIQKLTDDYFYFLMVPIFSLSPKFSQ
jgi:exonuclease V gamma subunit